MIPIKPMIGAMPGIASTRAWVTRRICGTTETRRMMRRMRNARSTENGPLVGTRAIATTTKSKTFHGSRKNARPRP